MPDDEWSRLGQWSTAEGNYWEATVREELATAAAGTPDAALTEDQLDRVASALALGLKDLWEMNPRFPVPSEFEPAWMRVEAPEVAGPVCPSCSTPMGEIDDEQHGRWACSKCGLVKLG